MMLLRLGGTQDSIVSSEGLGCCGRCMVCIVRRTQLYLDDQLWNALRLRARSAGTTVSELVRAAVREQYFGDFDKRRQAMQAIVGMRKSRPDFDDSERNVRELRRGSRHRAELY